MTVVDIFCGMGRGRGAGSRNRRRQVSEQERAAAVEDYRESVGRLQHTAYRNMRQTVAYATIFVAVIATWMLLIGQATPATFPWYAVAILSGAFGLATYFVRQSRPRLYVLAVAVVLAVVGVTGMFLTN
ncbi:hypothetical protein O7600_16525 [Micromonospora sp. WMMA1998]|uniref:hypothetical protein n=1 Tax=Micromonospora sp. WMMA1998 TaxID=3015167 RepID=UPI00248C87D3|nr:hypothetical protein [Micromonospora sp. WMMA1998]WBC12789.1 hypothetical protein O7600_16525 [Micromonospora sp. WMMA1998]